MLNGRFLQTMVRVLEEYLLSTVVEILPFLLQVAQYLSMHEGRGRENLQDLLLRMNDTRVKEAITLLLQEEWTDIQSVQSSNLAQPM